MTDCVAEWYERYHTEILGYVRHLTSGHPDAEDICTQVWISAVQCADKDLQRGWFFAVARCKVIDWYKHQRVVDRAVLDAPQPRSFEDWVIDRMELSDVWRAAKMTDMQRRAMWLHAVEDRPIRELITCLNTTPAGAKALIHRARAALLQSRGSNSAPT